MNAIDVIDSGVVLPRIGIAEARPNHKLRIVWSEGRRAGQEDLVDLGPAIYSYKIYDPLRADDELFSTVRLIENGDVVAWDGDDLEMTAEMIQSLAEEANAKTRMIEMIRATDQD